MLNTGSAARCRRIRRQAVLIARSSCKCSANASSRLIRRPLPSQVFAALQQPVADQHLNGRADGRPRRAELLGQLGVPQLLAAGVLTGQQPPQDYKIITPLATIGVRGTVFDLDVQPAKVIVILESGQVTVTPRAGRAVTLNVPQTSVTVFASGRVEGPVAWHGSIIETASNWQFPLVGGGVCPFGLSDFDTCLPAPSKVCQWGKTASGMCVNNRLAEITQTGTLVYSQLGVNHNFSPYVPANPSAEKDYPIPINHFFELFLNAGF